jgi:hypothetical protein
MILGEVKRVSIFFRDLAKHIFSEQALNER